MQELFFIERRPWEVSPVVSTRKDIFSRNLSFFLGFSKYILATVRSFCQNFLLIPSPCSWKVKGRLQIVLLRVTPALISCFGLLRYTADLDSIPWGDFSKRHLRPSPPKDPMSTTWVFPGLCGERRSIFFNFELRPQKIESERELNAIFFVFWRSIVAFTFQLFCIKIFLKWKKNWGPSFELPFSKKNIALHLV